MQSGIREKVKYFDGIRDFTALRQAGFANISGHGTRELFSVCREIGKFLRPKNALSDENLRQLNQVSTVCCLLSNNNNNNNKRCIN